MKNTRSLRSLSRATLALACATSWLGACSNSLASSSSTAKSTPLPKSSSAEEPAARPLPDAPLDSFRGELLELALETVSALPAAPHIKTRSRAQEDVIKACLQLDQPQRALDGLQRIDNWRRGSCYADLAAHLAQSGEPADAQVCLDRAIEIAASIRAGPEGEEADPYESPQDWQRDHIRVRIARALLLLQRADEAREIATGVVDSEAGVMRATQAQLAGEGAFDTELQALDQVLGNGNFEEARGALEACAQLFQHHYGDEPRRSQAEARIRGASTLPLTMRIEFLMELAGFALDAGDPHKALELVDASGEFLAGARWTPEVSIALKARLAALRSRAGDRETARRDVDAALATYEQERRRIVDVERAGVLRSVAEAYQDLGDTPAARRTYSLAVDEGVVNPNSRPRAEDLSATCCSLALHGVEPDADLWAKLQRLFAGLGAPW